MDLLVKDRVQVHHQMVVGTLENQLLYSMFQRHYKCLHLLLRLLKSLYLSIKRYQNPLKEKRIDIITTNGKKDLGKNFLLLSILLVCRIKLVSYDCSFIEYNKINQINLLFGNQDLNITQPLMPKMSITYRMPTNKPHLIITFILIFPF